MDKIRNLISALLGLLALAALALGLTWLLGSQGARPAQQTSPVQTPTPVDTPTPTFGPWIWADQTPTPWLTPTPLPQPTRRPGPTETPRPLIQPAQDAAGEIIYVTGSYQTVTRGGMETVQGESIAVNALAVDQAGVAERAVTQLAGAVELDYPWGTIYPSPDGCRLAIQEAGWGRVRIFDTETGRLEQLAPLEGGHDNWFLGWHPDSRRMLYRQGAGPDRGLVLVDTEQYTLLVREDVPQAIRDAAVSPDGKWVVYSFSRGDGGILRILSIDGSEQRVLATCGDIWDLSWAPDGSKFGFFGCGGYTIMNANGEVLQTLHLNTLLEFPSEPLWSPDGRLLLYTSSTRGKLDPYDPFRQIAVRVIDVETGEERWALEGGMDPAWSPDGSQIVFVSARSGEPELWAVNLDGSNLRQLTQNAAGYVRFPVWRRARQP